MELKHVVLVDFCTTVKQWKQIFLSKHLYQFNDFVRFKQLYHEPIGSAFIGTSLSLSYGSVKKLEL